MGGGCYRSQLSSSWQSPEASVDGGDRRGTEERWGKETDSPPPQSPQFLTEQPQAKVLSSLNLSFLLCKVGS